MTVSEALDKLEEAGYVLDRDYKGIYLGRVKDTGVPLCDLSLKGAVNTLMSNRELAICYYLGLYP